MGDKVGSGKWAAGAAYGPVLSQTDLYLLNAELELHPVLAGQSKDFTLTFNLLSGTMGGFNVDDRNRDLQFTGKDEPATFPRVSQLYVITKHSPWVTVVKNDRGVTSSDILTFLWKDYGENLVSDVEYTSLNPRMQEHVKRMANNNQVAMNGGQQAWGYYTPAAVPANRIRRVDWLRERQYFDRLVKDDAYVKNRLGFNAPNVFVMELTS